MKLNVSASAQRLWFDISRFVADGEGYGAARDLDSLGCLVKLLPASEQMQWNERIAKIQISLSARDQAIRRGENELRHACQLTECASKLIDDEIILLLSKAKSLRSVATYLGKTHAVPWLSDLESLENKILELRDSSDIGPTLKKCEAIIRRNSPMADN